MSIATNEGDVSAQSGRMEHATTRSTEARAETYLRLPAFIQPFLTWLTARSTRGETAKLHQYQAEHPNSSLHIRSVQDDGNGATVTITVEDRSGRSDEAFAQDVKVLRSDLVTLQQRLQQEERLRLKFEDRYRGLLEDVLPILLDKVQPRTAVTIGQITAPTAIEGTAMSNKTYNVHGQAGAVGDNAHAHDMTFQQIWNQSSIDLPRLAEELKRLRSAMKEADDKDEQDEAIGAVAAAEKAASKGDGPSALGHLKAVGRWTLGIAEKIGVAVAAEAIKRAM